MLPKLSFLLHEMSKAGPKIRKRDGSWGTVSVIGFWVQNFGFLVHNRLVPYFWEWWVRLIFQASSLSWRVESCLFEMNCFRVIANFEIYVYGLLTLNIMLVFNLDACVLTKYENVFLCVAYGHYPKIFWIFFFLSKNNNIQNFKKKVF